MFQEQLQQLLSHSFECTHCSCTATELFTDAFYGKTSTEFLCSNCRPYPTYCPSKTIPTIHDYKIQEEKQQQKVAERIPLTNTQHAIGFPCSSALEGYRGQILHNGLITAAELMKHAYSAVISFYDTGLKFQGVAVDRYCVMSNFGDAAHPHIPLEHFWDGPLQKLVGESFKDITQCSDAMEWKLLYEINNIVTLVDVMVIHFDEFKCTEHAACHCTSLWYWMVGCTCNGDMLLYCNNHDCCEVFYFDGNK